MSCFVASTTVWFVLVLILVINVQHAKSMGATFIRSPIKAPPSVSIVGGGPAGLLTALMLAQRGYDKVDVWEQLERPPSPDDAVAWADSERSYNIGLNGRGQRALKRLNVMNRVAVHCVTVLGRLDWSPKSGAAKPTELIFQGKSYNTECIQRERLVATLLQEIEEKYGNKVKVHFETVCSGVEWVQNAAERTEVCKLILRNSGGEEWIEESSFVVAAEGAGSATIREAMEKNPRGDFKVTRFEDKNIRVYKTIPLRLPAGSKKWRPELNFSARTGNDINLDALPTKEGFHLGVVLFRPGDERILNLKNGPDARAFFDECLPQFSPLIEDTDMETFAKKPISRLPRFSYSGPILNHGASTVLLGDAIHCVKPYFGQGVNSAFEDVMVLDQCLDAADDNLSIALPEYSVKRGPDARALVEMSHKLDGGFVNFILPLIVDELLSKVAPKLFTKNVIAQLQDERNTFAQIQARKRIERVAQFTMVGALLAVVTRGVLSLSRLALRLVRLAV